MMKFFPVRHCSQRERRLCFLVPPGPEGATPPPAEVADAGKKKPDAQEQITQRVDGINLDSAPAQNTTQAINRADKDATAAKNTVTDTQQRTQPDALQNPEQQNKPQLTPDLLDGLSKEEQAALVETAKIVPAEQRDLLIKMLGALKPEEKSVFIRMSGPLLKEFPTGISQILRFDRAALLRSNPQQRVQMLQQAERNQGARFSEGTRDFLLNITPDQNSVFDKVTAVATDVTREQQDEGKNRKALDSAKQTIDGYRRTMENPNNKMTEGDKQYQREITIAKLQMSGVDVTNEEGLLTGTEQPRMYEGTQKWEKGLNRMMGMVRYAMAILNKIKGEFNKATGKDTKETVTPPKERFELKEGTPRTVKEGDKDAIKRDATIRLKSQTDLAALKQALPSAIKADRMKEGVKSNVQELTVSNLTDEELKNVKTAIENLNKPPAQENKPPEQGEGNSADKALDITGVKGNKKITVEGNQLFIKGSKGYSMAPMENGAPNLDKGIAIPGDTATVLPGEYAVWTAGKSPISETKNTIGQVMDRKALQADYILTVEKKKA